MDAPVQDGMVRTMIALKL
jgi:hypothetical protein